MSRNKKLWIVDATSFVGFLLALKPEITGFTIHEWLGIAVCGVLIVHILMHWQWLVCVTQNFHKVKSAVKFNYGVDIALGVGFFLILVTGLIISNILSLSLSANLFSVVRFVHVASSFLTFVTLMVKFAKHMDWIKKVTASMFGFGKKKKTVSAGVTVVSDLKKERPLNPARREAMRMAVIGGAGAVLAGKWMLDWSEDHLQSNIPNASESALNIPSATVTSEALENGIMISSVTMDPLLEGVRACRKGFQCEYPGRCHDYQDVNGNNLCDLGEVLAFNLAQADDTTVSDENSSGNGNQNRNGQNKEATATTTSAFTAAPTEVPLIVVEPTADALAGVRACRKQQTCAYPGKCHDYQDINANGLCDLGEVYARQ